MCTLSKRLIVLFIALIFASCATQNRSYRRIAERYTAISETAVHETYVIEIIPAFTEPVAFRYEFSSDNSLRGSLTTYGYQKSPVTRPLEEKELIRIRSVLRAFDWNRVTDPTEPNIVSFVPDDIGILFRARSGGVYHEARVGPSRSSALKRLLYEVGNLAPTTAANAMRSSLDTGM